MARSACWLLSCVLSDIAIANVSTKQQLRIEAPHQSPAMAQESYHSLNGYPSYVGNPSFNLKKHEGSPVWCDRIRSIIYSVGRQ